MVIFHSYVSLPEGIYNYIFIYIYMIDYMIYNMYVYELMLIIHMYNYCII